MTQTAVKRYNAEIHSQSAIEGILELRNQHPFPISAVEDINVEIFDVAFHIIGGGEEGDKTVVRTKEEADHSLPYVIAVALLDGAVMPEQYWPDRIQREDVQTLLRRVRVKADPGLSARFPRELPCRLSVHLKTGQLLSIEKSDFEGFSSRPATWASAVSKFKRVSSVNATPWVQDEIIENVKHIEETRVRRLAECLQRVAPVTGINSRDNSAGNGVQQYGGT